MSAGTPVYLNIPGRKPTRMGWVTNHTTDVVDLLRLYAAHLERQLAGDPAPPAPEP